MSVKKVVLSQYQEQVDREAGRLREVVPPNEGWIRTVRKALGMSGAQLGRRMGVTRAAVSKMEKAELSGGVTIKAMTQTAEAMGCRFVYGVVPEASVQALLEERARQKAVAYLQETSVHMALEDQAISKQYFDAEARGLQEELLREMPSDLWED